MKRRGPRAKLVRNKLPIILILLGFDAMMLSNSIIHILAWSTSYMNVARF